MIRLFVALLLVILSTGAMAQDVAILLKEGLNLERTQKEEEALAKYKEVLKVDVNNVKALIRGAELSCAVGARQPEQKTRTTYYNQAKGYANAALLLDSNSADANYVRAVVAGKLTEVESDNKKIVEQVKDIRIYVDKALQLNPNHARANYVLGRWIYEMVNLNWAKKAALKLIYGGLPEYSIDSAYKYMEKARTLDQYFVLNYLDLAKAYKQDNKPAKAIEVLNKLVRLPTRTADDIALKEEGKKLLNEMQ